MDLFVDVQRQNYRYDGYRDADEDQAGAPAQVRAELLQEFNAHTTFQIVNQNP